MKTRRAMLFAALPLTLAGAAVAQSSRRDPTPAGGDHPAGPTPAQTEGPYFTPNSPLRAGLYEPGMDGTRLRVGGLVLDPSCRPLGNVLVDLWQADAQGRYDNAGYRLRGHQFTDAQGRWQFETIVPAIYPGRTRHLHVKLQAPYGKLLTTQLYFPGDTAGNARDRIFDKRLLMNTAGDAEQMIARYDFVLAG
ncbi:intradiol ring-cleavage dioxygenase [Ferrovibrio sp.]|uniref:dioxygenase family protein n=1 Tax=Ferrovibrio sp. TaxID=1917215 RepID=UPI000CC01A4C|nr:intradiol ring-cleavage dioxygenase [Ferrovibrio sp.]PJI43857.1 MAG: intradiol ring-cleavage dioxygenase [Ferrovibrio sp.]